MTGGWGPWGPAVVAVEVAAVGVNDLRGAPS